MLIASKGKNQIINMDEVVSLFVNNEKRMIAASTNGRNNVLDEYGTREEAMCAMGMLIDRIRTATDKTTIVFMPTDDEVKAYIVNHQDKTRIHHYANGKKVKGHGGS